MFIRPSRFWFVVLTSHSREAPEWLNGIQSLRAGNTNVINCRTLCKLWNEFDGFFFFKTYVSASWGVRSWSHGEWGLFAISMITWECAGSWEWLDFHYCPKIWVWAVRFGENHGQILKLGLTKSSFAICTSLTQAQWHQPPPEAPNRVFQQRIPLPVSSELHLCVGGLRLKLVMACFFL